MIIVGLTGGIATGKSTVTALLRQNGITVLDCDEIAHAVVRQGRWGYKRVVKAFGSSILLQTGEIDRDKLGEMVFNERLARRKLNSATHVPVALELVRQLAVQWLSLTCVAVVDMPLLFETGSHKFMWPRVFVTCSHDAEVERLMKRDKRTNAQAEAKVMAQMHLHMKEAQSDIIIDNSGDQNHSKQQVLQLVNQLQGKYKLLGFATSPVMLVTVIWVLLRLVRGSSA